MSFSFRFLNYNMANSTSVSLRDIGGGFTYYRQEETDGIRRSTHSADDLHRGPYRPAARAVPLEELMAEGPPSWDSLGPRGSFRAGRGSIAKSLFQSGRTESAPSRLQSVLQVRRGTQASAALPKAGGIGDPLSKGVDCAFGALSESNWSVSQLSPGMRHRVGCNTALRIFTLSAAKVKLERQRSAQTLGSFFRCFGFAKVKVAERVAGNLETVVICSSKLEAVDNGVILGSVGKEGGCGRNPLKCFVGQTFEAACGRVHFVLMGAHFPIRGIGAAMQDFSIPTEAVLERIKAHVSMMLQKILQTVHEQGQLTRDTILILQGDLNSRTVLANGKIKDVLYNTLQCPEAQETINSILPVELRGEWREVVTVSEPCYLPVTYRFNEKAKMSDVPRSGLRLRELFGDSRFTQQKLCHAHTGKHGKDHYREVIDQLGETLDEYELWRPKADDKMKPYRIPSCTDRVIFYAPKALQDRCTWECPRGYEVNYQQLGSDHKPVLVEGTLRISPGSGPPILEKE